MLLLAGVLVLGATWGRGAEAARESLSAVVQNVDDAAKPLAPAEVVAVVGEGLKLDKGLLTKLLLEKTNKLSDIVLVQFVVEKTKGKFDEIWQKGVPIDWSKALADRKLSEAEASDRLTLVHADLAFALLDRYEARQGAARKKRK